RFADERESIFAQLGEPHRRTAVRSEGEQVFSGEAGGVDGLVGLRSTRSPVDRHLQIRRPEGEKADLRVAELDVDLWRRTSAGASTLDPHQPILGLSPQSIAVDGAFSSQRAPWL